MKTSLIKEWLYGLRKHSFLILGISFVSLSILTPIMMYIILPEILYQEMLNLPLEEIEKVLDLSQQGVYHNFLNDFTEIGLLIICLVLAKLIPQEIKEHTWHFPKLSGIEVKHVILSKWMISTLAIMIFTVIAFILCYLYTGLLSTFDLKIYIIFRGALFFSLFASFVVALILWIGTLTKNTMATLIITYVALMLSNTIFSYFEMDSYLPIGLMRLFQTTASLKPLDYLYAVLSATVMTALLLIHSIYRIKHLDLITHKEVKKHAKT